MTERKVKFYLLGPMMPQYITKTISNHHILNRFIICPIIQRDIEGIRFYVRMSDFLVSFLFVCLFLFFPFGSPLESPMRVFCGNSPFSQFYFIFLPVFLRAFLQLQYTA